MKHILKQDYHTRVAPYLYYCNVTWEGAVKILVDKLFRLQKGANRVVSNAEFLEQTQPIFIKENVTNICIIYEIMCCIYVFKNRDHYEILCNVHITRNTSSLHIQFESLTLCKKVNKPQCSFNFHLSTT